MNQVHVNENIIRCDVVLGRSNTIPRLTGLMPNTPSVLGRRVNSMRVLPADETYFSSGIYTWFITLKNSRNETLLYNYNLLELWPGSLPLSPYNGPRLRLFNLVDIDTSKSSYTVTNGFIGQNIPLFSLFFYLSDPQLMTNKEVKEFTE